MSYKDDLKAGILAIQQTLSTFKGNEWKQKIIDLAELKKELAKLEEKEANKNAKLPL